MERNEMMLYGCNLDGIGLEIAPSHSPVLPKKSGYKIETLDCLDQVGLRQKYATHDVNLENIEEVDYVWNGGSYAETIGKIACYNYIIASHVIEHTVDIVAILTTVLYSCRTMVSSLWLFPTKDVVSIFFGSRQPYEMSWTATIWSLNAEESTTLPARCVNMHSMFAC